jgi:hypothetical protein
MSFAIIGEGGRRDPASLAISTRRGNHIPNSRKRNRRPESLLEARRMLTGRFPNIRNRSLDATYSCLGMIFANRRAWVENDHLEWLLHEDEYVEVQQPEIGDLIVYRKDGKMTHVGLIIERSVDIALAEWKLSVLSQWGQDGEYIHSASDVPEETFGTDRRFYSERKNL